MGATPNEVYLSNGEHPRTIVSAVGSKPWPLLDDLRPPTNVDGCHRRVPADRWATTSGGGDCAAVPTPGAARALRWPVRQEARQQIGRTSAVKLAGRPFHPFRSTVIGQGISIGKNRRRELKGSSTARSFAAWRLA